VTVFTTGFYLFNRTHPDSRSLKLWAFIKDVSWPYIGERLKAFLIILMGLLVFIIPGLVKKIHYIFVGFVVFFNRDYKEGKISVLKYSKQLTKGLRLWIFLWLIGVGSLCLLS